MLILKSKRGLGHIEMVIGFVFFIGFIFFMFLFLSPWDNSVLPNSALNLFHDSFYKNTSTTLASVFVKTNYSGSGTCFHVDLPSELFRYSISDGTSLVTKLGGMDVNSSLIANPGQLNLGNSDNFFRVAISPEFSDEGINPCPDLSYSEIGGIVEMKVVSYSKLVAMNNSYYSDYSALRKSLGVADIFDFAVVPEGMNELDMEPKKGVPDTADVLAQDYIVKVLKSDGSISNERINLRIW